ncbi:MAG: TM1802 family CRISPR-associated protein, partial [Candidatus Parvarchaeota archaeon]
TALDEVTANKYNITKELFRLISQGNYNSDAFITIKFGARYSSGIDGFPSVFKYLSQVGRPSKKGVKKSDSSVACCVVCNSSAPNRLLKEQLQFVTFDKPNFAPNCKKENVRRYDVDPKGRHERNDTHRHEHILIPQRYSKVSWIRGVT